MAETNSITATAPNGWRAIPAAPSFEREMLEAEPVAWLCTAEQARARWPNVANTWGDDRIGCIVADGLPVVIIIGPEAPDDDFERCASRFKLNLTDLHAFRAAVLPRPAAP